jgi:glycosyltransferase involved in cell wall biosynthesis
MYEQLRLQGLDVRLYQRGGQGCCEKGIIGVEGLADAMSWMAGRERHSLVHSHLSTFYERIAEGFVNLVRPGPMLLTVHGNSLKDSLNRGSAMRRRLVAQAIRCHEHVIGVGPHVVDAIRTCGIDERRISMLPAFIPPVCTQEARDAMPSGLWLFVEAHEPVIAFTSSIVVYKGKDLYGHDQAFEMLGRLRAEGVNAGLVVALCRNNARYADLWRQVQQRADQPDVRGHVLFLQPGNEFFPVLEKADVFVRPTRAEGWATSLAEALCLNVPSVASDVCLRAEGTVEYRSEDIDDFVAKVKLALAQGPPVGVAEKFRFDEKLIALYMKMTAL